MAAPGLDELTQASWSGGMCRAVARHLIPGDAAYDIQDGLLDDDGNVYQRGPTARLSSGQLGTIISALWEAQFSAGRRMIGVGTKLGVMDAAGTSWVDHGSYGSAVEGGGLAAQIGEWLFIPTVVAGVGQLLSYAGAIGVATYASGGTFAVTNGSATLTGSSTAFTAGTIEPGTIVLVGAPTTGYRGVVKSVDSATQITLADKWQGPTAAGNTANGSFQQQQNCALSGVSSVAAVSGRLLVAIGRKVYMTPTIDQNTGQSQLFGVGLLGGGGLASITDYHEFPADVVAMTTLRDVVYVFTKAGVWSISNVGLPIVDAFGNPQHRRQKVSGDIVLRSPGGVAPWRDSVVIGAVDGVYVMDAAGGFELVSRSITPLWQAHMKSGHVVGQIGTFRDHAFVPVYSPFGLANSVDEVLVCRLDRRTKTPVGSSAPWSRISPNFQSAEAGWARAFAVQDPYGSPKLVGGLSSHGFLTDYTGLFRTALPAATAGSLDANNAPVAMVVETREYVLDAGALATVRDVALEYESTDGQIKVSMATGTRGAPTADPTYSLLASTAAGNYATQNPRVLGARREARRVSFKLDGFGGIGLGVSGWRLRAVRLRSRLRGRRR